MNPVACAKYMLILGLLPCCLGHAAEPIKLFYNDRPPYLVPAPDGSASGLTGTPSGQAFITAGVPFVWAKMPTNRQLLSFKKGEAAECGIGWFRNPERELFAKFTKAIYRDKPTVALARNGFTVKPGTRLEDVMASKSTHILAKDNYSYGAYIDGLIARLKPKVIHTTSENSLMVEMIRMGRADFMFVAEEEASFLVEEAGASAKDFHLIRFPDMPDGERRHIMCSKHVPDEVIQRLNKAISFE